MTTKFISISLIICVLGSLLQFTIPLSWYVANFHHITTELCVNRNNPDINCNGICQLEKKMHQNHEHQNSEAPAQTTEQNTRINFFFSQIGQPVPSCTTDETTFLATNDLPISLWISEPPSPPPKVG